MMNSYHSITLRVGLLLLMSIAIVPPTIAHHSFAMFDKNKPTAISGTVSKLEWANPHVFLFVEVRAADGHSQQYAIECASINSLSRMGWKPSSIKVGDKVSVALFPYRDGRAGGLISTVTLPNGTVLKG